MVDNKKISEDIVQHKRDAEKVLKDLETMVCNIRGGKQNWADIVETRKRHVESFIKTLEKQQQEFEHFK